MSFRTREKGELLHFALRLPRGMLDMIRACCRRVAEDGRFQHFVPGIILFNGVVMGLETSSTLMVSYGRLFGWLNLAVQAVFVLEIAVRPLAHSPRIFQFFRDGWNCFDFAVVAISFLPEVGPFATVARLARVLRVTRVLSYFPELRLIVSTMVALDTFQGSCDPAPGFASIRLRHPGFLVLPHR